ncbi:hypothetical protein CIT292_07117 [Citrobacter youngae ATCC 29220]|uniref:Uncharacterized protein n=1 Tax=Citrobacter youngae ATCC 29220 TaxID=500640 RepID=D4B9H7_9ENTR|nr:hypothetical protein CIT292_07117 [Citrobacter youngae ATCC 29220]
MRQRGSRKDDMYNFATKLSAISIFILRQINNETVPLLNSALCLTFVPIRG